MSTTNTIAPTQPQTAANGGAPVAPRVYTMPRVNIVETKTSYVIEAELPGVNNSGLEVLLEGNELTLVGRRQQEPVEAQLLYRESSTKDFRRVFVLDPNIDTKGIEAKLENGTLRLNLPKNEQVLPRKITVAG